MAASPVRRGGTGRYFAGVGSGDRTGYTSHVAVIVYLHGVGGPTDRTAWLAPLNIGLGHLALSPLDVEVDDILDIDYSGVLRERHKVDVEPPAITLLDDGARRGRGPLPADDGAGAARRPAIRARGTASTWTWRPEWLVAAAAGPVSQQAEGRPDLPDVGAGAGGRPAARPRPAPRRGRAGPDRAQPRVRGRPGPDQAPAAQSLRPQLHHRRQPVVDAVGLAVPRPGSAAGSRSTVSGRGSTSRTGGTRSPVGAGSAPEFPMALDVPVVLAGRHEVLGYFSHPAVAAAVADGIFGDAVIGNVPSADGVWRRPSAGPTGVARLERRAARVRVQQRALTNVPARPRALEASVRHASASCRRCGPGRRSRRPRRTVQTSPP